MRFTVAPVTRAPEASATKPRIDAAWAASAKRQTRIAGEIRMARTRSDRTRKNLRNSIMSPPFPSERKRLCIKDRSPDLRLLGDLPGALLQWLSIFALTVS